MSNVQAMPLPTDCLLAQLRSDECHRDAYAVTIPRTVTLSEFITAFYSGGTFTPERKLLGLVKAGWKADRSDIAALADARTDRFAAWTVEARTGDQLLMQDHQDLTCSWFWAEPVQSGTRLWFGSGVRQVDKPMVRLLMPFHHWYSRVLLKGALQGL